MSDEEAYAIADAVIASMTSLSHKSTRDYLAEAAQLGFMASVDD